LKDKISHFIKSVINSYAILYFSQSKILGCILLGVSFFNFNAGLAGLLCAAFAVILTTLLGYQKPEVEKGLLSFNALLFGLGFGTFYHLNPAFFIWLAVGCLVCIFLTIALWLRFSVYKLPILSLPFIISFWILLAAANSIFHTGLLQKSSSILNELSTHSTAGFAGTFFPYYLNLFFRALSAVLFQNNALAGLLIALGLLIHSRIAFTVVIIGFISVYLFNALTGVYPDGPSYYHLGSNFMMTAMAVGSFFLVPSFRSYSWAIITVPVTFLLVNAFTKIIGQQDLPILSLPFCVATLLILYLLTHKKNLKLALPLYQHYSPEENLYRYLNGEERLHDFKYFNIKLPFLGSWVVSQGYDGAITHKGDWGQALDFVIVDDDYKTCNMPGIKPSDFYCFGKPVLACGDGIVEEVVDYIEDNEIGQINSKQNWGNTIVIRHTTGLYSKVSHLKKHSSKVKQGDVVKQGEVIALCGNSGRSPEPHLHFQLQVTPFISSKTLAYPFACYISQANGQSLLERYKTPQESVIVHSLPVNDSLRSAFSFQPGYVAMLKSTNGASEKLEVYADSFDQKYIYSSETNSYTYFVSNGTVFYFTAFYGDKNSLLYLFYLAAYKVVFTDNPDNKTTDSYPLQLLSKKPARWLNDLVAPFFQFIRLGYESANYRQKEELVIKSEQYKTVFSKAERTMAATIRVEENSIRGFKVYFDGITTEATWTAGNLD
jgi:urea transporter/murein DD-endopeptidase MepM/ murein hydrolase activator NlpD